MEIKVMLFFNSYIVYIIFLLRDPSQHRNMTRIIL